jgi:hypothetical protein
MPAWVLLLLGLSALGFALSRLDGQMGLDAFERFGKALAILFVLAVLGGLVISFVNADWR